MTDKKDYNDDDEITLVVNPSNTMAPPPLNEEMSDIHICYNLGDPVILGEAVTKVISNFSKVRDITDELRSSLDLLMLEKFDSFNIPPTNAYEMKKLLEKIIKEEMHNLMEYNELNNKRNSLLEKLNHCDPIEPDLKAMLDIYPKIKDDANFSDVKLKIKQFLSDISVMLNYDTLFDDESTKLVFECVKEFKRTEESIQYVNRQLNEFESKELTQAEEYTFAKSVLQRLSPQTQTSKIDNSDKRVKEMLDFIKENQEMDFTSINFEEVEKYKILNSYVNLKNLFISFLHNSRSVKEIENVALKITEDALKGKKTSYNYLKKTLINEDIPFVSSEMVKKSKTKIEDNLEKLNDACYFQARMYNKENSWKTKAKILIASATLFSLGVIGYVNNTHVSVPEYAEQKTQVTKQLYEDKKDAIKKMEKEVLTSISHRKLTIKGTFNDLNEFKNEKIQKIKDKKNKLIDKKNKIKQILNE